MTQRPTEIPAPTCWLCQQKGGIVNPLDVTINVDNALEFFHGDCAEEFYASQSAFGHGGE